MFCDCAIPRTPGAAPHWETPLAAGEAERFARRGGASLHPSLRRLPRRQGTIRRPRSGCPDAGSSQPDGRSNL